MKCKHCRREIKPATIGSGMLGGEWMHTSGMFTCPRHPETIAEPADERWESVYARIGPVEIMEADKALGLAEKLEQTLEIRVELRYKGQHTYSVTRVDRRETEAYIDTINFILDRTVKRLDAALDAMEE